MSDDKFLRLCETEEDISKIEAAILSGANVNARDKDGNTALISATRIADSESAELLLSHGANPL